MASDTANGSLALICTCQQVYEEVTQLTYGRNTFRFSDAPHGDGKHMIEASDHCGFCARYRRMRDRDDLSDDWWGYCWDNVNDRHYIAVPQCDITSIITWLRNIGPHNRASIKTIHFHFSTAQFTKVMGMHYPNGTWSSKPCPVGGDELVGALNILAENHNLHTLRITFASPDDELEPDEDEFTTTQCAFRDLFTRDRPLRSALCRLNGLSTFDCEDMPGTHLGAVGGKSDDLMTAARKGLQEVKSMMESKVMVGKKSGWQQVKLGKVKGRWEKKRIDQVAAVELWKEILKDGDNICYS